MEKEKPQTSINERLKKLEKEFKMLKRLENNNRLKIYTIMSKQEIILDSLLNIPESHKERVLKLEKVLNFLEDQQRGK